MGPTNQNGHRQRPIRLGPCCGCPSPLPLPPSPPLQRLESRAWPPQRCSLRHLSATSAGRHAEQPPRGLPWHSWFGKRQPLPLNSPNTLILASFSSSTMACLPSTVHHIPTRSPCLQQLEKRGHSYSPYCTVLACLCPPMTWTAGFWVREGVVMKILLPCLLCRAATIRSALLAASSVKQL